MQNNSAVRYILQMLFPFDSGAFFCHHYDPIVLINVNDVLVSETNPSNPSLCQGACSTQSLGRQCLLHLSS